MEIKEQGFAENGLSTLFQENNEHVDVQFGTVTLQPGERVPKVGLSKHKENEYSIIVKGSVEGESGGESYHTTASNAMLIPAGEEHWAVNSGDEPCEIVWVLVKKND